MKNFRGISEVGSLIGVVHQVDMQMLEELGLVRFKVDVKSIAKFPLTLDFSVPPDMYDIHFSVEEVIISGTLEISQKRASEANMSDRQKKTKSVGVSDILPQNLTAGGVPVVAATSPVLPVAGPTTNLIVSGEMAVEEIPDDHLDLPVDGNGHALTGMDDVGLGNVDDEILGSSQERVHFSQEVEQPDSQESFATKVKKTMQVKLTSTAEAETEKDSKLAGLNEKKKKATLPPERRRCERLKGQEDADRTDLAMKRAEAKNSIFRKLKGERDISFGELAYSLFAQR
ncbi:uncharacterized protein LOC106866342 isoform X2 [Brachypodium distachyon]|uniref:uncharacterized protein LOC106866342 isoform X2 n=1 Tax=Brachypodium distachyon TaxID=15368 RepID=UPI00071E53DD|nr:uncharacterized protein LOC106866342 isoform X2 [Brachypodium distachyon]|eukprot:XP_014755880.1 uncharacterized protein LOC106866342 isoform X2 [Brachypodium distachyon]